MARRRAQVRVSADQEVIDLDTWADQLSAEELRCRDKGHNMDQANGEKTRWGYWRKWVCVRCRKYGYEEDLDRTGNVLLRHGTWYGQGYLAPRGVAGVATRSEVTATVRAVEMEARTKGQKVNSRRERAGYDSGSPTLRSVV